MNQHIHCASVFLEGLARDEEDDNCVLAIIYQIHRGKAKGVKGTEKKGYVVSRACMKE